MNKFKSLKVLKANTNKSEKSQLTILGLDIVKAPRLDQVILLKVHKVLVWLKIKEEVRMDI